MAAVTATDRLAQIAARADATTDGPWGVDGAAHPGPDDSLVVYPLEDGGAVAYVQPLHADAEFIAHARADVPALVAALRAVLDLHKRGPRCRCCGGTRDDGTRIERWTCTECPPGSPHYLHWPCATVRAVEAALGEVAP